MKMDIFVALLLGLMALVDFGISDPMKNHEPPGKQFYQSLHETERLDFLAFSLGAGYTKNETKLHRVASDFQFPGGLGINDHLLEKFKTLEVPQNFTTNLYAWIRAQFKLDQPDIRTLILTRSVCLSNGQCINIDDIGALCCPF